MSRICMFILTSFAFSCFTSIHGQKAADAKEPLPSTRPAPALTPHRVVEVTLKNGSVFSGVVLDGSFVEKPQRAGYVRLKDDQRDTFGAGIRLWYYQNLSGYMFLLYRSIESVRIVTQLNEADMSTLAETVASEDSKKAAAQKAAAEQAAKAAAAKPAADVPATNGWGALDAEQTLLLQQFSPEKGWTPERYAKVQRAMVVDGAEASTEENEWFLVYPEWHQAWKRYAGIAEPSAKDAAAKAKPTTAKPTADAKAKSPTPPAAKTNAPAKVTAGSSGRAMIKIDETAAPASEESSQAPVRGVK